MTKFDESVTQPGNVGHLNGDQFIVDRPQFFGRSWDASIVDGAQQVPTPVGKRCMYCREPIDTGDRGFIRTAVDLDADGQPVASLEPIHAECELSGIVGHSLGLCSCTSDKSARDLALLVWERFEQIRTRDLALLVWERVGQLRGRTYAVRDFGNLHRQEEQQ